MSVKTKVQLKAFADANITSNGVNSNSGGDHNTMLTDLIDSMVNSVTDSLSIVTNVYRAATVTIGTSSTLVTFSSPMPSANYEIIIFDTNGIGTEKPTNKLAASFKIKGLTAGDIIYLVILTN